MQRGLHFVGMYACIVSGKLDVKCQKGLIVIDNERKIIVYLQRLDELYESLNFELTVYL